MQFSLAFSNKCAYNTAENEICSFKNCKKEENPPMTPTSQVYEQDIHSLYAKLAAQYVIPQRCMDDPNIKHGLRNADGTGVLAGVSNIGSVQGYYMEDGYPSMRKIIRAVSDITHLNMDKIKSHFAKYLAPGRIFSTWHTAVPGVTKSQT